MRREQFQKVGSRFLWMLLVCGVLLFWVAMGWPCTFRSVTGIPCPGCGLSRAWLAALRLDFTAAFAYHPMFWAIPMLAVYALFDGRIFRRRWLNNGILAILLGGIAVCYVIRIVGFLSGELAV